MPVLASGSQVNEHRGDVRGVILAASTGEEQRPWLGRLGAFCMKTSNHQWDD